MSLTERDFMSREQKAQRDAQLDLSRRLGIFVDEHNEQPLLEEKFEREGGLAHLPKCLIKKNGKILLKENQK